MIWKIAGIVVAVVFMIALGLFLDHLGLPPFDDEEDT
jgi:hypothetical protein